MARTVEGRPGVLWIEQDSVPRLQWSFKIHLNFMHWGLGWCHCFLPNQGVSANLQNGDRFSSVSWRSNNIFKTPWTKTILPKLLNWQSIYYINYFLLSLILFIGVTKGKIQTASRSVTPKLGMSWPPIWNRISGFSPESRPLPIARWCQLFIPGSRSLWVTLRQSSQVKIMP